jgi:hypothetical protein
VTHCEEVPVPGSPGEIMSLAAFNGAGKTVDAWLSEFVGATGFRWYIRYISGVPHFYWFNPATQPVYAVTLKDNIDRSVNSSSQWRVGDSPSVTKSREAYANRVLYSAAPDPPAPTLAIDYDTVLTETTTGWTAVNGTTTTLSAATGTDINGVPNVVKGAHSLHIAYSWVTTIGNFITIPEALPLVYRRLDASWRDMSSTAWGQWVTQWKLNAFSMDAFWPAASPYGDQFNYPNAMPVLYILCSEAAITGIANLTSNPVGSVDGLSYWLPLAATSDWLKWSTAAYALPRYKNVLAIGVGLRLGKSSLLNTQYTFTADLWLDDMRVEATPLPTGIADINASVETSAVTAGTEAPREVWIDTTGMTYTDATALANLALLQKNRTQIAVSNLTVDGLRNIPLNAQIPVVLPKHGLASATYPITEIAWKLWEAGDETALTIGDIPFDEQRAIERLRKKLDSLG